MAALFNLNELSPDWDLDVLIKKISDGENDSIEIENKSFDKKLDISYLQKSKLVIFKKCIFHNVVVFNNSDFNCGVKFIDCSFDDFLLFKNCKASSYDNELNFEGFQIEFNKTRIKGLFFYEENQIERGIRIINSTIGKLEINTLYIKLGLFEIHDSIIENQFDISNGFYNYFDIGSNSKINTKLRIQNLNSNSITFNKSSFEEDIFIWAGNIDSISFDNCVFVEDLHLQAISIKNNLTIYEAEFKKSIIIEVNYNERSGMINNIFISSSKFANQFIIYGNNGIIKDFNIKNSKQLEGDLYINSCNILNTDISGDNYNANIVFRLCYFNKLCFDSFYNYSTLSIVDAKAFSENSEIIINQSNLGLTHFFNIFFDTFDKISIYNSILIDIITANVKWFKAEKLNSSDTKESYNFAHKKEIYRQLKFALEKQGDRIESLRFKSLEMKAYKDELFSNKKWYNKVFSIDRFILWLGKTNDFGLNWFKPVYLILLFGLLFYFLIIVGVSDKLIYSLNFSEDSIKITIEEFWYYKQLYPQLMNPVHSLNDLFKNSSNIAFAVYFYDYLLKIFLAFFIFQIVSAFRKFMK